MLWKITDGKLELQTSDCKQGCRIMKKAEKMTQYVLYLSLEEFEVFGKILNISSEILQQGHRIDTSFRSEMQFQENMMYGSITVIDVMHLDYNRSQVFIVLKENLLVLVSVLDERKMIREFFQKAIERYYTDMTITKFLYAFLDALCQNGNETLEKMEKSLVSMEHELVENRIDATVNRDIFLLKKRLLVLKNYYEQIIDLCGSIQENEMEQLQIPCRRFRRLEEKAKRLSHNTQDICENVVHLREALDANLEYNLNQIMKVFTVVTTVFLPLTLIAGWYGMNFAAMPELTWKYGYIYVIVLSIAVVVLSFGFFKWKKLL